MSEFTVNLNEEATVVRIGAVTVPDVRVTVGTFGTVRVAGGIPGPPGQDGASTAALVTEHVEDTTPHPAYDDLPSLTLLFENGLV